MTNRSSLVVEVNRPVVSNDTVNFSWSQSEANVFQRTNHFFFRYEHLELGQFSELLWLEIFLALQLKVFARMRPRVEIQLPRAVPRPTATFWTTYHSATRVSVTPQSD